MSPPLIIRADASSEIGAGHVMRCLALAQAWKERAEGGGLKPEEGRSTEGHEERKEGRVLLVCAHLPEALEQRLKKEGCAVARIKAEPGSEEDVHQTLAAIATFRVQVSSLLPPRLVVDGYAFTASYHHALRAAGLRLMVMDDYAHQPAYEADILFNQNLGAETLAYNLNPEAVRLLGPKYALLRAEFKAWRGRERDIPAGAHKVLVSLGGADPDNVTARVMEALRGLDVEARIIVGGLNAHRERLRERISGFRVQGSGTAKLLTDVADMPEQMAWADVAILGAGSTCWEAALMGLPALMIVLADNQRGIAAGLDEEGIGVNLGESSSLRVEAVAAQVSALLRDAARRRHMSDAGRALVDGEGATRVVAALQTDPLRLRPVAMADAELLLRWSNDPETRAVSFSSAMISMDEHRAWLTCRLADPRTRMFIGEDEQGKPVGVVRFEARDGRTIVSVTVAPEARGRRLSPFLIAAGTAEVVRRDHPARIDAFIRQDNERSLRAFQAAGYRDEAAMVVSGVPARRLVWQARG